MKPVVDLLLPSVTQPSQCGFTRLSLFFDGPVWLIAWRKHPSKRRLCRGREALFSDGC